MLYAAQMQIAVFIQGRRDSKASPWMTEDGQLLPYIGEFKNPTLFGERITFLNDGKWDITSDIALPKFAVCEIRI